MAEQADGSIIIDSEIRDSGFEVGAKELEAAVKRMADALDGLSGKIKDMASQQSQAFMESSEAAKEYAKTLQEITIEKWEAEVSTAPIEDYKNRVQQLNEQLEKLDKEMVSIEFDGGSLENIEAQLDIIERKEQAIIDQDFVYDPSFEKAYENLRLQTESLNKQRAALVDEPLNTESNIGKFLDDYAESAQNANESSNEFVQGIEKLKGVLEGLEAQGQFFGDEEYDKAYLDLQKMQQALKDYRKELVSPTADALQLDTSSVEGKVEKLTNDIKRMREAGKTFGDVDFDDLYKSLINAQAELKNYRRELERTATQEDVATQEASAFSGSVRQILGAGERLRSVFRSAFARIVEGAKNAVRHLGRMDKSANKSRTSLLKMIAAGFGFRTLFSLWTKALSGIKEGLTNLAQYNSTVNQSISSMMSALTRLKNSLATAFAPILNVIAPILTKFINMISTAVTYIGMFFAALTGQKTFTKAKGVQEDFAGTVDDTSDAINDETDALNDAAEAAKEYLSPIDEINKITSSQSSSAGNSGTGGGGTGSGGGTEVADMFETVPIDSWLTDLADKFKAVLSDIFAPIKQAWADYGQGVMDAWKYALREVIGLLTDIGSTWLKVWANGTGYTTVKNILLLLQEIGLWIGDIAVAWRAAWDKYGETLVQSIFDLLNAILVLIYSISTAFRNVWNSGVGERVCGLILQILTNIVQTVKNLVTRFTEAWNEGGRGEKIAAAIFAIIDKILTFVRDITQATKEWASQINFAPLLDAVRGFLEKIGTVIDNIVDVVKPFYQNVVLPFLTWLIETALPKLIDWIGDTVVWLSEHIEVVVAIVAAWLVFEGVIAAVKAVVAVCKTAIALYNFYLAAQEVITWLATAATKAFGVSLSTVIIIIIAVIAIIALLVVAIVLVVKNWEWIKAKAIEIWTAIKDFFAGIVEAIADFFTGLWTSITDTFKGIGDWFKEKFAAAREGVESAFNNVGSWFGNRYNDIKSAFNSVGAWFGEKFTAARNSVNSAFSNIGSWFSSRYNDIKSVFNNVGGWFKEKFTTAYNSATNAFSSAKSFFQNNVWGQIQNVFANAPNWFSNIFTSALNGIKAVFQNVFNAIVSIVKSPINTIIGFLNKFLYGMASVVNGIAKMLNSLKISIPSWVPGIGGGTLGFNLPTWTVSGIPYLAKGAVIPPNAPFMAMLGDQRSGTNIEAPLETIKQGLREVQNEGRSTGNGGTYHFVGQINKRVLFDEMMTEAEARLAANGRNPFELA